MFDITIIFISFFQMIELKNSIYCTNSILEEIRSVCRQGTSVARYLMVGVFNPANILDCTLTGRKVCNQGRERQQSLTKSLHNVARETIKGEYSFVVYR